MSYAISAALQSAIYQQLAADTNLQALVNGAIFDVLPSGAVPPLYVTLGPERARDASDMTGEGAWHDVAIAIVSEQAGFSGAKAAAAIVCDALVDAPLTLSRGTLVSLRFAKAAAARVGTGDTRRIDLTFRARVCDA